MKSVLIAAVAAALLAACATPQERAQKVIDQHGPYCEALGFARGSDAWRSCLQSEQARKESIVYQINQGTKYQKRTPTQ